MMRIALLCAISTLSMATAGAAKDDWQADLHKWAVSSDTNPNCKVRYTVGMYRPDFGAQPVWGMMTEKMFRWFSGEGAKLAPQACPVSHASQIAPAYRILFSVSPMTTSTQTTHGAEAQTVNQPVSGTVNATTTYSDGSSANTTATITGDTTSTVVVPTETTISRSSVTLYMYTYRVEGGRMQMISTDNVTYSRVMASGSGDNAAGAELGAGIGNAVRAAKDRHRADKLYEGAIRAIMADSQDGGSGRF